MTTTYENLVEEIARTIGDASETAGQTGHLRSSRLSPQVCASLARAALAVAMKAAIEASQREAAARIAALIAERDHWRDFASAEGLEVSHQTTRADAAEAEVTRLLAELETARAGTSDNVAQYIKNARDQASEFDRMESAFLAEEKHQRDDLAQRVATVRADATVSAVDACGLPADAIERLTRERDALAACVTELEAVLAPFAAVGRLIAEPFGPALFKEDDAAFGVGARGQWTARRKP